MDKTKITLRQNLLQIKQRVSSLEVAQKSQAIADKVLDIVDWLTVQHLHIYTPIPCANEVDSVIIKNLVIEQWPHIKIVSPRANKNQTFPTDKFDLIIVPVLGFDQERYRLGYGGGWYDRFLASQPQAKTIGLAYSFAKVENLPHEPHDIPLQQIVTEVDIV